MTHRSGIEISSDRTRLDVDWIHASLAATYWAAGIPRDVVERSLEGSMVFGAYDGARQIALARVITDQATFAYLADVFVDPAYRGRGISVALLQAIMADPELQGLRRWMLATADAHSLYEKFGFGPLAEPARFMEISLKNAYRR